MRRLRQAIAPESGAPGAQCPPAQATQASYPHALLFPGSGATYPAGAPCPGHAQLPEGLSWRDLVSDGAGNWIVRTR